MQCATLKAYLKLLVDFSPVKQDVLHEHVVYEVWLPERCIVLSLQDNRQKDDVHCAVTVVLR